MTKLGILKNNQTNKERKRKKDLIKTQEGTQNMSSPIGGLNSSKTKEKTIKMKCEI